MKPVIHVQKLSKSFSYYAEKPASIKSALVDLLKGRLKFGDKKTISVLKDVSFEIQPGEFVGIMGKNGAGKSTLLKLISGIYTPTRGTIHTEGTIAPMIELGAGFHPELSGYENIFLNASILGVGKKQTEAQLQSIIDFSELGEHVYRPIKAYSSGMLVRLGFAVAVHLDAPILLIDEVLAVGDLSFQKKCLAKIHELHQAGKTIILITHDPNAVKNHCTRSIIFSHQKIVYDGDPAQGVEVYLKENV
jgi:ABC-type polysaccharide/polyol phosphate transport system ATPase subunit